MSVYQKRLSNFTVFVSFDEMHYHPNVRIFHLFHLSDTPQDMMHWKSGILSKNLPKGQWVQPDLSTLTPDHINVFALPLKEWGETVPD